MAFVVEVARSYPTPPAEVFLRLADGRGWRGRMPPSFRPIRVPDRSLVVNDRLWVRVAGSPVRLRIVHVDAPRAIEWTGGVPNVLFAEHRFVLEPEGTGTLVRSIERWSGAFAARFAIEPLATRIAREQLAALA